jgi:hypothetical protein
VFSFALQLRMLRLRDKPKMKRRFIARCPAFGQAISRNASARAALRLADSVSNARDPSSCFLCVCRLFLEYPKEGVILFSLSV